MYILFCGVRAASILTVPALNQLLEDIRNSEFDDSAIYVDELINWAMDNNEIPYGIAKARTGDPYEWIERKIEVVGGEDVL